MEFQDVLNSTALTDQTVESGGTRELAPAGETVGRLVSYVELGPQNTEYLGVAKVVSLVQLGFELLHPKKNIVDGKGYFISTRRLTLSTHSKAAFFKLFTDMRYGREDKRHCAQMLGEPFRITIKHTDDGKYANIAAVSKPYMMDMESGEEKLLPVPEATRKLQLFLWDNPTEECWDSIFIDGSYTNQQGVEVSKNRLQEAIMSSPGFNGSAVQMMLSKFSTEQAMPEVSPFNEDTGGDDLDALGL